MRERAYVDDLARRLSTGVTELDDGDVEEDDPLVVPAALGECEPRAVRREHDAVGGEARGVGTGPRTGRRREEVQRVAGPVEHERIEVEVVVALDQSVLVGDERDSAALAAQGQAQQPAVDRLTVRRDQRLVLAGEVVVQHDPVEVARRRRHVDSTSHSHSSP